MVLPDSLEYVGAYAFLYCSGIRRVDVSSLEKLFGITFASWASNPNYYAKNLYVGGELLEGHVTVPDGVSSISGDLFCGYNLLTGIALPDGLLSIGFEAFSQTGLTGIDIPEGITTISSHAFSRCASLREAWIPSTVKTILTSAFYGCTALEKIVFAGDAPSCDSPAFRNVPSTCTVFAPVGSSGWDDDGDGKWQGLEIAYYDFERLGVIAFDANGGSGTMAPMKSLAGIGMRLPSSQFSRDGFVFDGWATEPNGEIAYADEGVATFYADTTLYAVWRRTVTVSFDANGGEGAMDAVELADGIAAKIPYAAFTNAGHSFEGWATTAGGPIVYRFGDFVPFSSNVTLYAVWGDGVIWSIEGDVLTGVDLKGEVSVEIPVGVTAIGTNVFCKCTSLLSVAIPFGVTNIAAYAFDNCRRLRDIVIPDSVLRIGGFAFAYCRNATNIVIGSGVEHIGWQAFD